LPYEGIASHTEIYRKYLESSEHQIDYIVCPEPIKKFKNLTYAFYNPRISKFKTLNKKLERKAIFSALKKIIKSDNKYIIKVIDDSGLLIHLNDIINTKFSSLNFYIIYFLHGHELNFSEKKMKAFNEIVNLNVYLTSLSYNFNLKNQNKLIPRAKVIHNGIDTSRFKPINKKEKKIIKKEMGFTEESTIFLWCANSDPKKGIGLALSIFKKVKQNYPKAILLVIGIKEKIDQNGVVNIGRIPNTELPKYYQIADIYLFTSLWAEGFPLTLTEALKSGCYCIASNYGGVAEVLNFGKYGKLVKKPHFEDQWIKAIDEYFHNPIKFENIPEEKYSSDTWNCEMNKLLIEIKKELIYNE
jgi:glycosyltransferase involved in cell wall biosynthesis